MNPISSSTPSYSVETTSTIAQAPAPTSIFSTETAGTIASSSSGSTFSCIA